MRPCGSTMGGPTACTRTDADQQGPQAADPRTDGEDGRVVLDRPPEPPARVRPGPGGRHGEDTCHEVQDRHRGRAAHRRGPRGSARLPPQPDPGSGVPERARARPVRVGVPGCGTGMGRRGARTGATTASSCSTRVTASGPSTGRPAWPGSPTSSTGRAPTGSSSAARRWRPGASTSRPGASISRSTKPAPTAWRRTSARASCSLSSTPAAGWWPPVGPTCSTARRSA